MLQELPSSPRRSRAAAAAAVAVAVLALVPLRLVARPAPPAPFTSAEVVAAHQDRAVTPDAPEIEAPRAVPSLEQTPRERAPEDLSFVLLLDGQHTISGSPQDLERARSFQRGGDALLWVRRNGREYVIRDEEVLRQARDAWKDFNTKELGQFVDEHHFAEMGKLLADSSLAQAGVEFGRLGAEIGGHAMEAAAEALRSLPIEQDFDKLVDLKALDDLKHLKELKHLESLKALEDLKHLQKLDKLEKLEKVRESDELRDLESAMRDLHKSLRDIDKTTQHEIERSFRDALDQHHGELHALQERLHDLAEPLRDLEHPIREMAEPLAEMGRHMGDIGREIGDAAARAMEQLREVIDRAIATGAAKPVK